MFSYFESFSRSAAPVALLAGDSHTHANYVSFLDRMGYQVLPLDRISATLFPCMGSLYFLTYDLLILPGGGDFSSALYQTQNMHASTDNTSACSDFTPYSVALDMLQFSLLTDALHKRVPIIGICKGMQLINVYFGGTLFTDLKSTRHISPCKDTYHAITALPSWLLSLQLQRLSPTPSTKTAWKRHRILQLLSSIQIVNSFHHQAVRTLAPDFICLQRSSDRITETMIHPSFPIIGFQWHPERLPGLDPNIIKEVLSLL